MYVFARDVRIHRAYDYASSLREFVCESPLLGNFRKPRYDMEKDNDNDNKYRILYEIHNNMGEVPEYSGLYCSMSIVLSLTSIKYKW